MTACDTVDAPGRFTVLGSRGFIGSHLVEWLCRQGHRVYAPDRIDAEVLARPHGHILYGIGLTADFRTRPLATMQAHVCLLRELLESAEFESLTYLSSTRVYQGAEATHEEAMLRVCPQRPDDLYALSKLAGEALCLHGGRQQVKVARLSNIVGLRKDRDLFIDQLLHDIVTHGALTLRSAPASSKDYLWIEDAVEAIAGLAQSPHSGCFNLASGENVSNQTLLDHLHAHFEFRHTFADAAPVLDFPPIDVQKIGAALSFRPQKFDDYFPQFIHLYKKSKGLT